LFCRNGPKGASHKTNQVPFSFGYVYCLRAADGSQLAERRLGAAPVFDGLIAAAGRLYLSTADGHVVCLGQKAGQ